MPKTFSVFLPRLNKTIACPAGKTLLEVLTDAGLPLDAPCGGQGICGKCRVTILHDDGARDTLACRLRPDRDMAVELPFPPADPQDMGQAFRTDWDAKANENTSRLSRLGLAVDVGATTLAVSLVDLESGAELGARAVLNPQSRRGADVISRVVRARRYGESEVRAMRQDVIKALGETGLALCAQAGAEPRRVREIAAAGNTVMLHLLLGVDPSGMAAAPFTPVFLESRSVRVTDLPFDEATLFTLPCVSAWVGADVVAGFSVCDMHRRNDAALFVDIGTNGELALAGGGRRLACSCAAGPALEGMNIRCGMRAAEGAIEDLTLLPDGSLRLSVIGGTAPAGICGSGILSALREFLRARLVTADGRILTTAELPAGSPLRALCRTVDGQPALALTPEVPVTQKDIRHVQLAKAAFLSGALMLIRKAAVGAPENLKKIFVAGQFGNRVPVSCLTACGILPPVPESRIEYVGNTALKGARAALLSPPLRREMEDLARSFQSLELASEKGYEELFLECLAFPPVLL